MGFTRQSLTQYLERDIKKIETMDKLIQITAGRGPAECNWVVAKVLKAFITSLKEHKITHTIIQKEQAGITAVQSVILSLSGKELDAFLSEWIGTIQWIGKSPYRTYHKRKNWFIKLQELPQVAETSFNEKDVKYQAMRSTGPGGQNVNKVNSAVRATHIPTGIQCVAMDSRSQHQNKKLALQRLKARFQTHHLDLLKEQAASAWEQHLRVDRGNPVRIFEGSDFKHQKKNKSYASKRQALKNDLKKKSWD